MNLKNLFKATALLILIFGCINNDSFAHKKPVKKYENSSISIKSTENSTSFTLFQNINTYTNEIGNSTITGEIFCPQPAIYTFGFGYMGNGGSYVVSLPNGNQDLRLYNGKAQRTVTIPLAAGVNEFSVDLLFSGSNQHGEARLTVEKINGNAAGSEAGCIDLVAQGQSNLIEPGGGSTYHWICTSCYALNSTGTSICIDCGKKR